MKKKAKYMEVYLEVKNRIVDEVYAVGEKLPPGDILAQEFETSKLTVKKGLDMLVSEGVLLSRSGYGTEVVRKPIDNSKVFGPSDGLLSVIGEGHVESEIHTFSIELPSKKVAEQLKIQENEYIYNIVRSRFVDKKPYSLEQTFMPLSVIPGLQPQHLKKSVYEYIRKELGLDIQSSHLWMRGDLAKETDSAILGIDRGSFMIEIEKVVSLSTGAPFEYSITRHLYQDFVFEAVFIEN